MADPKTDEQAPGGRAPSRRPRPAPRPADRRSRQRAAGEGRRADTASWNVEEAVPAPNPIVAPDARLVVESLGRWLGGLATRPRSAGRRLLDTGAELGRVAVGRSIVAPAKGDGRFADPTWLENPAYRRLMQGYLAWRDGTHALVDEAGLDPKLAHQVRFVLNLVTEAMAPSNGLLTNPAAVKRAYETGGASIARGAARMVEDWRSNHGMPTQADRRKFALGGNLACTPGAVVHRTEMFELLQYSPTTRRTFEVPMLMVPAQLNKYYVVDLAPERSLMEFAVSRQIPTFAISWRNPEPQHRDWGFDAYVAAAREAAEVVREIRGSNRVNLAGYCGGGLIVALLLAHLAAIGDSTVNSATLMVTVLDWDVDSQLGAFVNPRTVGAASRRSESKGVRSGREMNRFLSWVRPNELVWQFWVNNYLLGADPPAFDLLYWNQDSTNLPHALNVDVLKQFMDNPLVRPGAIEVLGTPIDLRRIELETYIMAGLRDHISPWRGCYRTAGLMAAPARFVLSSSGHIAAIVSDPANKKAAYHSGPANQDDPDRWLAAARQTQGSWWPDWTEWLAARSGSLRTARQRLGSRSHPPLGSGPGQYVLRELTEG
jgi:polyhydroxyalkanoate synthase subunit PhaC